MRLPALPLLSYGTDMTQEYRRKRLTMGDGYSVRALDGLNAKVQRWKLTWNDVANADAEMLRLFFEDLAGVGLVRWTPFNQPSQLLWTAEGFNSAPSSFGKSTCTVNLTQEFDLVGPAPGNITAPAVTGTGTVGNLLTTSNGTWSNAPGEFYYEWLRDDVAIPFAIQSTYRLSQDDAGHQIRSRVTSASNEAESAPVLSAVRNIT